MPDDVKAEPVVEPEGCFIPLLHSKDSSWSMFERFTEEVERQVFAAILGQNPKAHYVNEPAVDPRKEVGHDPAAALDDPTSSVADLAGDELGAESVVEE